MKNFADYICLYLCDCEVFGIGLHKNSSKVYQQKFHCSKMCSCTVVRDFGFSVAPADRSVDNLICLVDSSIGCSNPPQAEVKLEWLGPYFCKLCVQRLNQVWARNMTQEAYECMKSLTDK